MKFNPAQRDRLSATTFLRHALPDYFRVEPMIRKLIRIFSSVRMQLAASVFVAIAPVLVLTYIVNQSWFWRFAPEGVKQFFTDVPWVSLVIGLLALTAAWLGGEHFILRQVRLLSAAAKRLWKGDMNSRTGLHGKGELGQLAETFDGMAAALQQRSRERETAEKILLFRAMQQTVVSALGQFALTSNDLEALVNQAVIQVGHRRGLAAARRSRRTHAAPVRCSGWAARSWRSRSSARSS